MAAAVAQQQAEGLFGGCTGLQQALQLLARHLVPACGICVQCAGMGGGGEQHVAGKRLMVSALAAVNWHCGGTWTVNLHWHIAVHEEEHNPRMNPHN